MLQGSLQLNQLLSGKPNAKGAGKVVGDKNAKNLAKGEFQKLLMQNSQLPAKSKSSANKKTGLAELQSKSLKNKDVLKKLARKQSQGPKKGQQAKSQSELLASMNKQVSKGQRQLTPSPLESNPNKQIPKKSSSAETVFAKNAKTPFRSSLSRKTAKKPTTSLNKYGVPNISVEKRTHKSIFTKERKPVAKTPEMNQANNRLATAPSQQISIAYKNNKASSALIRPKVKSSGVEVDKSKKVQKKVNFEGQDLKTESVNSTMAARELRPQVTSTHMNSGQVIQMDNLNIERPNDMIEQISNYISQANIAGKDIVDLKVNSSNLGRFDITVMQSGAEGINLEIGAQTEAAEGFFKGHQNELVKALSDKGFQIAELKINSSQDSKMDFSSFDKEGGQNAQNQQEQNSDQQQSNRRKKLWQQYRERKAA